jgi:hypothetical protein
MIEVVRGEIKEYVRRGDEFVSTGDLCKKFRLSYISLREVLIKMVKEDTENGNPLWSSFVAPRAKADMSVTPGMCGMWFAESAKRAGHDIGVRPSEFVYRQRDLCREIAHQV